MHDAWYNMNPTSETGCMLPVTPRPSALVHVSISWTRVSFAPSASFNTYWYVPGFWEINYTHRSTSGIDHQTASCHVHHNTKYINQRRILTCSRRCGWGGKKTETNDNNSHLLDWKKKQGMNFEITVKPCYTEENDSNAGSWFRYKIFKLNLFRHPQNIQVRSNEETRREKLKHIIVGQRKNCKNNARRIGSTYSFVTRINERPH